MHNKLIAIKRMRKNYLFSLDEGLIISSGAQIDRSVYSPHEFTEVVAPLEEREEQWKRIKSKRLDQRTFGVYKNMADYCDHFEEFIKDNLIMVEEVELGNPFYVCCCSKSSYKQYLKNHRK